LAESYDFNGLRAKKFGNAFSRKISCPFARYPRHAFRRNTIPRSPSATKPFALSTSRAVAKRLAMMYRKSWNVQKMIL
jgi:hypothetical protein